MHKLQLSISEEAYVAAQAQAKEQGYASTEVFLNDLLTKSLLDEANVENMWSPERIRQIKEASADIAAGGRTFTVSEVRDRIAEQRREWDRTNP